jgi:hypothetical protein
MHLQPIKLTYRFDGHIKFGVGRNIKQRDTTAVLLNLVNIVN